MENKRSVKPAVLHNPLPSVGMKFVFIRFRLLTRRMWVNTLLQKEFGYEFVTNERTSAGTTKRE